MVDAAQAASRSHDFWKAELARLEPRLGMVAIGRKLLVVVWHVLTKREADRHADPQQVAAHLLNRVFTDVGARNLPDGQTAAEFVRNSLDTLKLGKELQRVTRGKRETLLPPSSQPGAAPAAEPKGKGQVQNTKAAQEKRKANAAAKRAALEAKREATAAQKGKPRQPRSDKGVKRGPHVQTA